ncbi:MAG: helix-turn-helix domain-containing protein, partial [Acidobacteriota bacterium]
MPMNNIDLKYTDGGQLIFVKTDECPIRDVVARVSEKWSVFILLSLEDTPQRFMVLKRRIEGVSQRMLTQTLRRLERDGLVAREVFPEVPPRVEYRLTPLGRSTLEPLRAFV